MHRSCTHSWHGPQLFWLSFFYKSPSFLCSLFGLSSMYYPTHDLKLPSYDNAMRYDYLRIWKSYIIGTCINSLSNEHFIFVLAYQGLWFNRDSHLWMLPHMTDDLLNLLLKNSISTVQQLLFLPKQNLQSVVGSSTASRLYQVGVNMFSWVSCM